MKRGIVLEKPQKSKYNSFFYLLMFRFLKNRLLHSPSLYFFSIMQQKLNKSHRNILKGSDFFVKFKSLKDLLLFVVTGLLSIIY